MNSFSFARYLINGFNLIGEFCDKFLQCEDANACRLNFNQNVSCKSIGSTTSATRAPYVCYDEELKLSCENSTRCCDSRYRFSIDVQQCICKFSITISVFSFIILSCVIDSSIEM